MVKAELLNKESETESLFIITGNDVKTIADIEQVGTYSAGYIYNIVTYHPQIHNKAKYYKLKSKESLLEDERAIQGIMKENEYWLELLSDCYERLGMNDDEIKDIYNLDLDRWCLNLNIRRKTKR